MNKLLNFNPQPFETESEFEGEFQEYESEYIEPEWEAELEFRRPRGRTRYARSGAYRPQRLKSKGVTPKFLRTTASIKPGFRFPSKFPFVPLKPQYLRFPTFPIVQPGWPLFPMPERPNEPRAPERAGSEPGAGTPPEQASSESPSEYARWVQSCLNQVMGLRLTIDGILNAETRSAIRSFQERQGLRVDGLVGPDTEQALKDACKPGASANTSAEPVGGEPPNTPSPEEPSKEFSWESETEWEFGGATGTAPKLLKQESTPPGTTLYVEIELGIVDKFGIKAAPMTGIFIPQGFKPDRGVDVILYLHGHKGDKNRRLTIDQYWDRQRFAYGGFREGVNAGGRNVILVAPTLGAHSESGRLIKPGGLDAYLDQVLAALNAYGPGNLKGVRSNLGSLILACHSGGGWPMRQLAGGRDRALASLRECWGFDCTYNRGDDTFWAGWGRSRPNARVYIYYIPRSQTAPLSESLRNKGVANAIVTASKEGRHNYVPITYWQERIGGANFLKARSGSPVAPTPTPTTLFTPTPLESPGGRRIQDKRAPQASDLVTVSGIAGKRIELHRLAGQAWQALVQAARADGLRHPLLLPTSGYRSPAYQAKLWEQAKRKYGSESEARKWVAPPGTSAHQSGRAIDFYLGGKNSSANVAALRQLPAFKWLTANAGRFGFYPYAREPWHWEYNPPARAGAPRPQPQPSVPPLTPGSDVRKMTPAQFIEFVGTNAQRSMEETGVPASVTVAQAIIETGWGKHTIGEAKNLFGIKGKGPAGSVLAPTKEFLHGKWVTVNANFAKYDSFEQSITEHAKFFLRNRRYAKALQFKNDADRFAREIHKAGYATAPDYSDKLIGLMRKHKLYRFDRLSPVTPVKPQPGPIPSPEQPDIVSVKGIKVARQIAPQVNSLLAAAESDGIRLGGWGYRSNQSQIELRKKHCGTSHYDIYEKPSSQCKPPTARPGASMHEKGLAIDFTHNGGGITNQNNPAFKWLSRNAGRFGLRNLPSEPWHWSVNGR